VNLVKLMFGNARSFNAPYTIIHAAAVRNPPRVVLTAEHFRLTRICLCALPCLSSHQRQLEAYFWTVWTGQPHEVARADMPTPEAMPVTSDGATPLSDGLRRACGRLLKTLLERPAIAALALPQPPNAHAYYYDVIKHPRDLQGILHNLESYQTLTVRATSSAQRLCCETDTSARRACAGFLTRASKGYRV